MVVASGAMLRPAAATRAPDSMESPSRREPPHPSTTTVDGSLHEPVSAVDAGTQTPRAWAPPPWLSEAGQATESEPAADPDPATEPAIADPVIAAAPAPVARTVLPQPTQLPTAATPPMPTLDEVALRMQRIKASAAAIRDAIEVEAQRAAVGPSTPPPMAHAPRSMASPHSMVSSRSAPAPAPAPALETIVDRRPAANDGFDDAELDADLDAILPARGASVSGAFETRPAEPTREPRRNEAAAPTALERDFLGGDDDFDEDEGFGDGPLDGGAAFAPAARPLPWRPILIGAGVMVVIGAWLFRAQLFPSAPVDPDANVAAEVRPGSVAPEKTTAPVAKPAPAAAVPAPAAADPAAAAPAAAAPGADPAAGKPVVPEAWPAPIAAATQAGAPPVRTPPDADTTARLDEARSLYVAAKGGTQRKKLAEAKTLLQEILTTAPMQADALLLLSQIELELGNADAALTTAGQCIQAAPEIADCWLTIGVLQQDRRKKADAVAAYEKYLALAPDGRYAGDVRSQLKRLQ